MIDVVVSHRESGSLIRADHETADVIVVALGAAIVGVALAMTTSAIAFDDGFEIADRV